MRKSRCIIKRKLLAVVLISLSFIGGFIPKTALALRIEKCSDLANTRLVGSQNTTGIWANEECFTSSILAERIANYSTPMLLVCLTGLSPGLSETHLVHNRDLTGRSKNNFSDYDKLRINTVFSVEVDRARKKTLIALTGANKRI